MQQDIIFMYFPGSPFTLQARCGSWLLLHFQLLYQWTQAALRKAHDDACWTVMLIVVPNSTCHTLFARLQPRSASAGNLHCSTPIPTRIPFLQ
jgi:hypothetical protein